MEKVMRDIMFDAPKDAALHNAAALTLTAETVGKYLGKNLRKVE